MNPAPLTTNRSLGRDGRVAGALYMMVVAGGLLGLAYVPGQLGALDTPAALATTLSTQAPLFRLGIAALLVMEVAFLLLPFALYRVFREAGEVAATWMVALAVASVPVALVAIGHRWQALALLEAGVALSPDAAATQAWLSLRTSEGLMHLASLFWGLWLLPFGLLVLRSARIPRVFGVLLVLGGIGYVAIIGAGLAQAPTDGIVLRALRMAAAAGEIGSGLWLLVFGARLPRAGRA